MDDEVINSLRIRLEGQQLWRASSLGCPMRNRVLLEGDIAATAIRDNATSSRPRRAQHATRKSRCKRKHPDLGLAIQLPWK